MSALHILQHALGVDEYGQGEHYRTHFVTGLGSDDHPTCMGLVADGLMTRRDGATLPFGGDDLFHVTPSGQAYVAEHSPPSPKLTRGQRRYRAWLAGPAEWMSFGDYVRSMLSGASMTDHPIIFSAPMVRRGGLGGRVVGSRRDVG